MKLQRYFSELSETRFGEVGTCLTFKSLKRGEKLMGKLERILVKFEINSTILNTSIQHLTSTLLRYLQRTHIILFSINFFSLLESRNSPEFSILFRRFPNNEKKKTDQCGKNCISDQQMSIYPTLR